MKQMKNPLNKQKMEVLGGLLLLAVFIIPFLSFADCRKDMYVDQNANGFENGSAAHPYHTISAALDHADERTDVHVAKGDYHENITIEKGVQVFGDDTDDVVIRAESKSRPVVTMKHNTELDKVTVKNGDNGILVREDSNVSIIDVVVKDNDGDGIQVDKADVNDKFKVNINDSTIVNNGGSGIYSRQRRLVLMDNEVSGNGKDGIDLDGGTGAWIQGNTIRSNDGSGMKFTLDGSNIWTKENTLRDNDGQGIEVNAWGGAGRIDINKGRFENNKNYAIARDARAQFLSSVWNGLTVEPNTVFSANGSGNVSPIIFPN